VVVLHRVSKTQQIFIEDAQANFKAADQISAASALLLTNNFMIMIAA
jgi:hypothetical protein